MPLVRPPGALVLLVAAVGAAAVAMLLVQRGPVPAPKAPAVVASDAGPAAGSADGPAAAEAIGGPGPLATDAAERADATPGQGALDPAASVLLDRARAERELMLIAADVLEVRPVQHRPAGGGRISVQMVRVRCLDVADAPHLRRYVELLLPLCPEASEARFGCRSPFGSAVPGQVRQLVLARGRPDLGVLAPLFRDTGFWLVLVGPELPRQPDPVLAAVPPELHPHLGLPSCNVFRGRVRELRRAGGTAAAGPPTFAVVDVLQVAQAGGQVPLGDTARLGPMPNWPSLPVADLVVGGEYWLVGEQVGLWMTLRAFQRTR